MKGVFSNWAAILTTVWLGFFIGLGIHPNSPIWGLTLNELGDFFAGIVGPIALLWLVNGYYQQSAAINIQSRELRAAVEQHQAQVEATRVLAENETRSARFDYYKILFECSKAIGSCRLMLLGDTRTASESKAQYPETDESKDFNAAIQSMRDQHLRMAQSISLHIRNSLGISITSLARSARSTKEVLIDELERLSKDQENLEQELEDISKANFQYLETRFRALVRHNVEIQNLIARSELFLKLEIDRQSANSALPDAEGKTPPHPQGEGKG